jgi:hypothetical protein
MKFYKRNSLNPKDPRSNNFAVDANGMILTKSVIGMEMPSGTTTQRPGGTTYPTEPLVSGTVRYNSDNNGDLEVYERSKWERIRTVRPATITVQNLGNGNYNNTIFGPLNSDYAPSYLVGSANIMVYVDNVYQIPVTNYTVGLTPGAINETVGATASTGTSTLQVSTVVNVITATYGTMLVTGVGIQTGTVVVSTYDVVLQPPAVPATVTNHFVVLSLPITRTINSGSTVVISYTTGSYITFTGTVPSKPVVALLGFDGYFPPG